MKKFKRFILLLLAIVIVSTLLSILIVRRTHTSVSKGFAFGAPSSQMNTSADGTYTVNYYGYPSTYRIQEAFKPTGDVFNQSSYEQMPFSFFYVLSNFIFWLALFMALLAPITIFYRPKKRPAGQVSTDAAHTEVPNAGKPTDDTMLSQTEQAEAIDENTRD